MKNLIILLLIAIMASCKKDKPISPVNNATQVSYKYNGRLISFSGETGVTSSSQDFIAGKRQAFQINLVRMDNQDFTTMIFDFSHAASPADSVVVGKNLWSYKYLSAGTWIRFLNNVSTNDQYKSPYVQTKIDTASVIITRNSGGTIDGKFYIKRTTKAGSSSTAYNTVKDSLTEGTFKNLPMKYNYH